MTELEYYRPSGKFGPLLFVYAAAALVGLAGLAWLYELALFYVPFIYLNLVFTLVFGAVVGMLASSIVTRSHCRSPLLGYGLIGVLGLGGLAASYVWNLFRFAGLVVARAPQFSRWEVMTRFANEWLQGRVEGGWQMRSTTFNGALVYVVWVAEAAIVLGFAVSLIREDLQRTYCEGCLKWMSVQGGKLAGQLGADVKPLLERGDLAAVLALASVEAEGDQPQVALLRAHCPSCNEDSYLTVKAITYSRDNKQALQEHKKTLCLNAVMKPDVRAAFTARFGATTVG